MSAISTQNHASQPKKAEFHRYRETPYQDYDQKTSKDMEHNSEGKRWPHPKLQKLSRLVIQQGASFGEVK
jgi:hypothetical protein